MPLIPVRPLALALGRSTYTPIRYAHAARVEEEDTSGSSSSPLHHEPHVDQHVHPHSARSQRKGKQRAHTSSPYEFPTKGKSGGPPDPFEILGLDKKASGAEIKSQYYKLALLLHPDSAHPSASTTNFATLHRAYTLLSSQSSRQAYLANGLGWNSASNDGTPSSDPTYDSMVAEVLRRKTAGAGQRFKSRAGSDAGSGAWGAYGMDGKWHTFPGAGVGDREPTYMSHSRFLTIMFGLAAVGWMAQYKRFDVENETRREADYAHHLDASHALATAREEARIHGHARREQMRRRVNEARMREAEQATANVQGQGQDRVQAVEEPRPRPPTVESTALPESVIE